jgi:hypothetical protein
VPEIEMPIDEPSRKAKKPSAQRRALRQEVASAASASAERAPFEAAQRGGARP